MPSLRVIVPNRPGLLAELTECLAEKGIDIEQIVVETHGTGALVRMEVARDDDALECLRGRVSSGDRRRRARQD